MSGNSPTKHTTCPACGSIELSNLLGSIAPVCGDCGAVTSEVTETQPTGESSVVDLESEITWKEYYTVTNSTEKRFATAIEILEQISNSLELDKDTRKNAVEIYADAAVSNLVDGRPTEVVVGAVVALAAREARDVRPTGCIAESVGVPSDSLRRVIRQISRELGRPASLCSPSDYVSYLCRQLNLDSDIEINARKLLYTFDESLFGGKNPVGIAGAAIYLAAEGAVTQRAIASTAGITEETLRVRLLDIRSSESNS